MIIEIIVISLLFLGYYILTNTVKQTKVPDGNVILFSKDNCYFCETLEEQIENNYDKINTNIIKVKFNENEERIITGIKNLDPNNLKKIEYIINNTQITALPTLLKGAKIEIGLLEEDEFNNFFEIKL